MRPPHPLASRLRSRARTRPAPRSVRPSLPPLLVLGLGTWGGAAGAYALAASLEPAALLALSLVALLIAMAGAVLWARLRSPALACLALGAVLGAACGLVGALDARSTAVEQPQWGTWHLTLVDDAREADRGHRALARVRDAGGRALLVSLNLPEGGEGLLAGDVVEARAALKPTGEEAGGYSWQRGIDGRMTASAWELLVPEGALAPLRALRRKAIEGLARYGGSGAPLMQALACGYRAPLDAVGGYGAYQACGLAHLVAVSGAHLSLMALACGGLMRAFRLPRQAQAITTLALIGGFLVFSGMPVSALRAALMTASSLGALFARRRPAALSALGGCLVAFPALDAPTALSASFTLSAGSTLGIVLFASLIASWLSFLPGPLRKAVGEPAALTLASAVVTQPYAAALFARLPLIALPANVLAAPLFVLACLASLASAIAVALASDAAGPLVALGAAATLPLSIATKALAALPQASIPVDLGVLPMAALSCGMAAALYRAWPQPRPRAVMGGAAAGGAALALALLVLPLLAPTQIIMLDVGQGDAILLRSGGATMLVDTGNQDSRLLRALARHGVWRLDAVAVTHADDDHCASLGALAGTVPVGRVIMAADALGCPCPSCTALRAEAAALVGEAGIVGVEAGDSLTCGALDVAVLWPRAFAEEGGNADSLCLLATAKADGEGRSWSALLTGDAEAPTLVQLADAGALGRVDVLKVGHHGSAVSLDGALARRLAPAVALVSAGEGNRYDHPRPEPLAALDAAGATTFRTDRHGDVTVTFTPDALRVDAQRPAGGESRVE